MYGASFVNAMVTDIIIRRLFLYFLTNEQLFLAQNIFLKGSKEDRRSAKKFPPRRPRREEQGHEGSGPCAWVRPSYQMRTLSYPPSPPLTTSLLRHTHSPPSSSTSPPSPTSLSSWSSPSKCPSKVPWPASPLFSQLYLPWVSIA